MYRFLGSLTRRKLTGIAQVRKKLGELPGNWIVLLLVAPDRYAAFNTEVLRFLTDELGLRGIYVTVNRPYSTLVPALQRDGIKTDRFLFIDAISKSIGEGKQRIPNCLFVAGPDNLVDIGIGVTEAIARYPPEERPFLFLDSLSTLLLHNASTAVGKFSHFTITKMRAWDVRGVVMSLEHDVHGDVINTIRQYCDEIFMVA
jgi:hypothetical protein